MTTNMQHCIFESIARRGKKDPSYCTLANETIDCDKEACPIWRIMIAIEKQTTRKNKK